MVTKSRKEFWEISYPNWFYSFSAYRKLARFCHPDKIACLDEDEDKKKAERAHVALEKAKACLADELKRGSYVRQYLKDHPVDLQVFLVRVHSDFQRRLHSSLSEAQSHSLLQRVNNRTGVRSA